MLFARRTSHPSHSSHTSHRPPAPLSLATLIGLFTAVALAACGGGDDAQPAAAAAPVAAAPASAPASAPAAAIASTTVSGSVVKGPVAGAQVCGYTVVANARGAALGNCAVTDATGNYSFSLPAGSGPLWLEANGGSYTDEATAVASTLPAGSPLTALATANGASVAAMLTPLTTLALNTARTNVANAAGNTGTLDATAFASAAAQVLAAFNLPATLNIGSTQPTFGSGINAYGTALTAISQMVANGSTLASILAATQPQALAAAYATAAAPPATPTPPAPPTPSTPPGTAGTASASGTVTATGASVAGSITPMATGFEVSVESDQTSYNFTLSPVSVAGFATATSTASVKVVRKANGTITVAYADPRVTLTPASCDFRVSATTCGVAISTPAGATHPVTLTFTNTPLVGGGVLNGSLVGDASGARWVAADLPRTTDGSVAVNGSNVAVTTGSSSTIVSGATTIKSVTLVLADGSTVAVNQSTGSPISVTRVVPPSTAQVCGTACQVTLSESAEGTAVAFANTPLSGGVTLNNSVFVGKTSGTLTASGSLGSFTPTADSVTASNDKLKIFFNNLGTAAQAGLSAFSVTVQAGRVIEIQATVGIGAALYVCGDGFVVLGYTACSGITVGANNRTLSFSNTVLSGGAVGAPKANVSFNGTLTAKGD